MKEIIELNRLVDTMHGWPQEFGAREDRSCGRCKVSRSSVTFTAHCTEDRLENNLPEGRGYLLLLICYLCTRWFVTIVRVSYRRKRQLRHQIREPFRSRATCCHSPILARVFVT